MQGPEDLSIEEYNYSLPRNKIADYPLTNRDKSKLLIQYPSGRINENIFRHITDYLPAESLLVFNDTRVVRARLKFNKSTGAEIEIFCLEPVEPVAVVDNAFEQHSPVVWKCFVGNARRWKDHMLSMETSSGRLMAEKIKPEGNAWYVKFSWEPAEKVWSEILEEKGHVPLPPYIKREDEPDDRKRYQTVFAQKNGSVAAPTAGLHFSSRVFEDLLQKNISKTFLTLHVGAGTFRPVVGSSLLNHEMHRERIVISRQTVEKLLQYDRHKVIPVGTTSVRTLESIYWYANKLSHNFDEDFFVDQWQPYKKNSGISRHRALELILEKMDWENTVYLSGVTRLMIVPGYEYKMTGGMLTNFHQPKSTLLLLVAAFLGAEWKNVYDYALRNDFRFLSYGDSCLFLPR